MKKANTVLAAVQVALDGIAKSVIESVDVEHISSAMVTDTVAYFGTGYRSDVAVPISVSADLRTHSAGCALVVIVAKVNPVGAAENEYRAQWVVTAPADEQAAAIANVVAFLQGWVGARKAA